MCVVGRQSIARTFDRDPFDLAQALDIHVYHMRVERKRQIAWLMLWFHNLATFAELLEENVTCLFKLLST